VSDAPQALFMMSYKQAAAVGSTGIGDGLDSQEEG
jgi:hypothetical protein